LPGPGGVQLAALGLSWIDRRLDDRKASLRDRATAAFVAIPDVARSLRPFTLTAAMLAAAAPWYVAVSVRTGGEWTAGFFFVHNVGRFLAPMEKHGGSAFFHPLAMLVGCYPWSCFLPLAIIVATRRVWRRAGDATTDAVLGLLLVWLAVWVGGFSAAATKLPNYVLPAYPAAAFLVAVLAVEAVHRGAWSHPRLMASGLGWLAFGGLATAATVLVTVHYGLVGAEPAALVGLIPVAGAIACGWYGRSRPAGAVAAFVVTGFVYTALAVGPASWLMGNANSLPGFVQRVQARDGTPARLGTYMMASPNVIFYARGHVEQIGDFRTDDVSRFLHSGPDALLLIPEQHYGEIASVLPPGFGIVARTRPLFRDHDVVAVGLEQAGEPRTASAAGTTR
jgi:4-amino-4-deoxy-L-arabinose transferase-like glycosyltransferase